MPLKTVRVPLATEFLNRDATLSKDSRVINAFIEKYYDGRTAVVKRHGLTSTQEFGFGMGQGIISHKGNLVSVVANTVHSTPLSGGQQLLSLNNEVVYFDVLSLPLATWPSAGINTPLPPVSATAPFAASLSGNTSVRASLSGLPATDISEDFLILKGANAAYFWNGYDKNFTKITDKNYPAVTVPGVVVMDGYVFVMDANGTIYNSNLQDQRTWNSLNFIQAEVEPDGGVGICKYLNYIISFGKFSLEFFYDAANPTGSPLARVDNAFSPVGCANGDSIVAMDSTVIWVSQTREGNDKYGRGKEVMMMQGMSPKKISTPFIDRILANDSLVNVRAHSYKNEGHDFYVLSLPTSSITLVYDLSIGVWYQWTMNTRLAWFLTQSCTLGNTFPFNGQQNNQWLINSRDAGTFDQGVLVNNTYVVTYQSYFGDTNTTFFVYDSLGRLVNTFILTGQYTNNASWSINQNYSGQVAYFVSFNVVIKANVYTSTVTTTDLYALIDPLAINNYFATSNVDPTGRYVIAEMNTGFSGTGDGLFYKVDLTTNTFTLVTTVLAANMAINYSGTDRLGTFIYNNVMYIPFKTVNTWGYHKYNLTTNAFISDIILSTNTTSVRISADVQNGFLSFREGSTNLTTVYNLNTSTVLVTGLPNFGLPGTFNGTSFILVDTVNSAINSYDGTDFRIYNYSKTLLYSSLGIFNRLGPTDPPVWSAFFWNSDSFYTPSFHTQLSNVDYLLDYGSGTVWKGSETIYNDGNNSINFRVITPNLDFGNNHTKFFSRLDLVGDKAAGTMNVSYTNNDYGKWLPYRTINMNLDRAKIHRLGKARRRAWEFYCTSAIPIRLEAFELHIDGGEER